MADVNLTSTLRQRVDLSLYVAQTAAYARLNIVELTRPHWILSHVREGEVTTTSRGIVSLAKAGDVMLHVPGLPFSETASKPGTHQWMAFDATIGAGQEMFRLYALGPVTRLRDAGAYAERFGVLEQTCALPASPLQELRALSLTLELFAHVLDGWQQMGCPPRPASLQTAPDRFQETLAYMEAHLHTRLTRDDLARVAHLHPGSFDRAWRAAYGTSPLTLLRDMRVSRARLLLERTDDTLDTIAQRCGLGEATHFSRVFRAHVGQSPGQWRQAARAARRYAPSADMPYGGMPTDDEE